MKMKSLVIVDYNATVNEKSGFAHTAHHARKILKARKLCNFKLLLLLFSLQICI